MNQLLLEHIARRIDDAPMIVSALLKVSEQISDTVKYLPGASLDNIAKSLKTVSSFLKRRMG